MRRALLGLLAVSSIAVGSALVATPAEAAAKKPVTISKVSTRYVGWNGTAVVKPTVKKAKKVKILKRSFTVQQGSKVVRRTKAAANLKVGTYRLTSKVTYKYKGKKRSVTVKQALSVKQGRCATKNDLRKLKVDPTFSPTVVGDSVAAVSSKLRSRGAGEKYTPEKLISQLEALKVLLGDLDPEIVTMIDEAIAEVKAFQAKGVTEFEDRTYLGCGKDDDIDVITTFANGELIAAEDDSFDLSGLSVGRAIAAGL